MTDAPGDDLDEIDRDLDDLSEEVEDVVERILTADEGDLRLAIQYAGDDHEAIYVREDVAAAFSDAELEERVETLVMKGLGDPAREGALYDFGTLDATIRWYEAVVVAYFPVRDWSGLVFTFDREAESLQGIVDQHF